MIGWADDSAVCKELNRWDTIAQALPGLTQLCGFEVTKDSVASRLRRMNLGAPTEHLRNGSRWIATPEDVPAAGPELASIFDIDDEDADVTIKRDTMPAEPMRFKDPGPESWARAKEVERILVCPDAHHPYVSKEAWEVFLAAGRAFKPDILVVLGDFCDHYCTSQHAKDPNRSALVEYEIAAANAALDQLDDLGAKRREFLQGNHCENLERYLMGNAPALFNMISTKSLLRLDERGWGFTPYRRGGTTHLQIGKVYYCHDAGVGGENAHVKSRNAYGHSVVHGHTHQAAVQYSGNMLGERHVGIMSGWLGDASRADYASDIQKRHWQHSFTVGHMEPDGVTHFQLVPIINGKCIIDGRLISAETA